MSDSGDEEKRHYDGPSDQDQETTPLGAWQERPSVTDRGSSAPTPSSLSSRYDHLVEVGRGGMGIVYKAHDRETDEVVAVKVLKPEIASQPDVIERFKAELRLARKITHKNVCRTYELLRFGDSVVITMEFVEGESLRSFLSRYRSVPLREGLEWSAEICEALEEAHAQGIIHRDLKPENIVIDRKGQVKVMDFGIARSIEAGSTTTGVLVGTPAYMSPEQAEGKPADPRSDIYALGMMLYEMFAGQPAFRADTPMAYMLMQIKEPPPPPRTIEPYLPDFVDRAIQKCLEKSPAKRFQSVAELQAALTKKTVLESASPRLQLPAHLTNSRRSDLGLLAAGVLGLAAFVFFAPAVIPEMGIHVGLTREMFLDKAQAEMVRRGWTPTRSSRLRLAFGAQAFDFLADRDGYQAAASRIGRAACPYFYEVDYGPPVGGGNTKQEGLLIYDPEGVLRTVQMPIVDWIPTGPAPPQPKALEEAKQEIQKTFSVDPNKLQVDNQAPLAVEGRHGYSFLWSQSDPSGLEWHYEADIFTQPTLVKRWSTVPDDYHPESAASLESLLFIVESALALLAIVLFLTRRLFSKIQAREVAVPLAAAAVMGTGFSLAFSDQPIGARVFVALLITGFFSILFVTTPPVVAFLAQRGWNYLTESFVAAVRLKPAPRATGLAVVRGFAYGLFVLGLFSGLLRLGLFTRLLSRPPLHNYIYEMNSQLPFLTLLYFVLNEAAATALLIPLLLALIRRQTSSTAALLVAGGLLEVLTEPLSHHSLHSLAFQVLTQFAIGIAFAWLLVKFDLLTLLAATFTYALWLRGYPTIPMFETVGNAQFWLPFLLWAAILGWGVFAGFRPSWQRLGGRLARAFE